MRSFLILGFTAALTAQLAAEPVLLEAEAFKSIGGWSVDPQFMDNMGSPYLLAHGLGEPVKDAATTLQVKAAGDYRVWVRTMDWVARWKAPGTPGRFQVLINGKALKPTFGMVGEDWHWQDGGTVRMPAGTSKISLHDLAGFEGRCDAILITSDAGFTPPNKDPEMAAFRRKCLGYGENPEPGGEYDFVVTGGGIAGTCAALSAARLGLKVALVQDRPVLGGNNSSEVRVWLQGARNWEPWPRIGDVVAEMEQSKRAHYGPANTAELYEDAKKLAVVQAETNITLLLEHRVNGAVTENGRIRSVVAQEIRSGRRVQLSGRWFADCTGDAGVGALAGAHFDIQHEDHMGPCNLWNVCECADTNALNTSTVVSAGPVSFPRCPWALDLANKPFPGRSKVKPDPEKLGGWYWESGFDRHPILEMEYVRDWNFRAMYGAWDAMKNVDGVLPNHRLNWAAYILGKRESRRLLGDVILTKDDLQKDRQFPDGCVPTGWSNDIHHPDPRYEQGFEGDAFISKADFGEFPAHKEKRPFWIPYRCLYSRNISNLFMAGRNISVTHDALGAVRVMRTCGCEGEIIGMAASVCKQHGVNPREVYETYLEQLKALMRQGTGKVKAEPLTKASRTVEAASPAWLAAAGPSLARTARVRVSGNGSQAMENGWLNDGSAPLENNSARWVRKGQLPHIVEFEWPAPLQLGAARIISGYNNGRGIEAPVSDFELQVHDGSRWVAAIPPVQGNLNTHWTASFEPVRAQMARLVINRTPENASRIWEVEFYPPISR